MKQKKKKKHSKLWMGVLAAASGAVGTAFLLRRRKGTMQDKETGGRRGRGSLDRWARPGMSVTFRAELMPGRSRAERTYRVEQLMPSGRVVLDGFAGEHTETEFEQVR